MTTNPLEKAPAHSFACDMSAIPQAERQAHVGVIRDLFARVAEARERDDGFAFRLPADDGMLERITSFIVNERRCCPFFRFRIDVEPHVGALWLTLSGAEDVKSVIEAEIGTALPIGIPLTKGP